jgi:hypothetical protein
LCACSGMRARRWRAAMTYGPSSRSPQTPGSPRPPRTGRQQRSQDQTGVDRPAPAPRPAIRPTGRGMPRHHRRPTRGSDGGRRTSSPSREAQIQTAARQQPTRGRGTAPSRARDPSRRAALASRAAANLGELKVGPYLYS